MSTVSFGARFVAKLADGRRVFVKVDGPAGGAARSMGSFFIRRERACLKALAGLAVPRLVPLPRKALEAWTGETSFSALVETYFEGDTLHRSSLTLLERLGAWMFIVEQLVGFRRRNILYTDIKCRNIITRKRPLSVTILDFGYALPVSPEMTYPVESFGYTAEFVAPEHSFQERLTERSLVYQLGMYLAHSLTGLGNRNLNDARRGLRSLANRMNRLGAPGLSRLLCQCLASAPQQRPRDYEAVLGTIKSLDARELPPKAFQVWRKLRAPYAQALAQLGL